MVDEEWVTAQDPHTGEQCWRSVVSGEFTVPGMPKPETWTEVVDKETGLLYYWNRRSGDTTNLGEPRPGPYGRLAKGVSQEDLSDGNRSFLEKKGDPSLLSLYNNPLGYLLIGMAAVGAAAQMIFGGK